MFRSVRVVSLVTVAILVLGLSASAGVVTFSAISGSWTAVSGGSNISGTGTPEVHWGVGSPNSGLRFDGVLTPLNVTTGTVFQLGTLTHFNQPIASGTGANGASLDVSVVNGGTHTFSFNFTVDETPNAVNTCVYPSTTPCADAIFFPPSGSFSPQTITLGGIDYHLQILGFGTSPSTFSSFFYSDEGANNSINLYASLTEVPITTPEPSSLLLLGCGVLAVVGTLRRRLGR